MPKTLILKSIKTGTLKTFGFAHALALFRSEQRGNRKHSHELEDKYSFDGNDIIRRPNNKDSREQD